MIQNRFIFRAIECRNTKTKTKTFFGDIKKKNWEFPKSLRFLFHNHRKWFHPKTPEWLQYAYPSFQSPSFKLSLALHGWSYQADVRNVGRFAYKSIRLHLSRFAYTFWDVSPTRTSIRLQPNTSTK